MKGEAKVIEYLIAGLRHELIAANQYWLHYRLLDHWGYKALAEHWSKESIEEMEHADDLMVRIIFLEGARACGSIRSKSGIPYRIYSSAISGSN